MREIRLRLLGYDGLVRHIVPPNDKIVDIGCDIGHLFRDYKNVTNVDFRSLKQIRDEFHDQTIELPNFVQADAIDLPFNFLEFDWAVLCELLEHVEDPVKILDEAQRVALQVIISVPNEHQWSPEKKPFGSHHKRFYDENTLYDDVEKSGLTIIELVKVIFDGWSHFILWGISKYAIAYSDQKINQQAITSPSQVTGNPS